MLITIIYNTDYRDEANSLKLDVINEWEDVSVNLMGIRDAINNAKYQVQIDRDVIYHSDSVTDNNSIIINSIKERL